MKYRDGTRSIIYLLSATQVNSGGAAEAAALIVGRMKLTYEIIYQAVKREPEALEKILEEFYPYITALATYPSIDDYGLERTHFDQDAVQTLRKKLLEEIPKWKEICK